MEDNKMITQMSWDEFIGVIEDINTDGYIQLTQFIKDTIDDLVEETEETKE